MSSLVDLFKTQKLDIEKNVGESKYFTNFSELTESSRLQNKFISNVDYSIPINFARFGLAEEYYKNAINYISQEYPYDGSKAKKINWINSLNDFEYYFFSSEYPRHLGYLQLSSSQYIKVYSPSRELTETTPIKIYRNGQRYFVNESLNFNEGFTFEGWINFNNTSSHPNIIYLNNVVSGAGGLEDSNFLKLYTVSNTLYISGTANNASFNHVIDSTNWHHYAITIDSSSTNLYVDGVIKDQKTTSDIFITGSEYLFYKLGLMSSSLAYSLTETGSYTKKQVFTIGSGSVLSFDNIKFWNNKRTTEQIGREWFIKTDGNDFDDTLNSNTIFYFKFNEGWVPSESDICLDYSGFKNNSIIYNYSDYVCRISGSAINEYGIQDNEIGDIIYVPSLATSSILSSFYDDKIISGSSHDNTNINALYKKFPSWIIEEDDEQETKHLRQLIQIVAVYFDDLYNKITEVSKYKHIQDQQDFKKIYPFYDKILTSTGFDVTELFSNLQFLEKVASRTETNLFDEDVQKIKNAIYQNIYNNLAYILKSKGTEKAIKSFLRSYGINENLVKINLYADKGSYTLADRYKETSTSKKTITLTGTQNIYLSSSNLQSTSSNNNFTLETSVVFPSYLAGTAPQTSSVFGYYISDTSSYNTSSAKLQAYITVEKKADGHVLCFRTGSAKSLVASSSVFRNFYDNTNWNFAISLAPNVDDIDTAVSSSTAYNYLLNFRAVNNNKENGYSFNWLTTSSYDNSSSFYDGNTQYFIGAEKQNLSGSLINYANSKYLYCNYWSKYLKDEELENHNKDILSYGVEQ